MSQTTSQTVQSADVDQLPVAASSRREVPRAASPLAAAMLLFASLLATPVTAETVLVPWLPNALPAVGFGNPLSALRVRTSGSAYARSSDISLCCLGDAGSFSESETFFIEPGDYEQSIEFTELAAARHGDVSATSIAVSQAEFGKLRAAAIASNTAGGYSSSGAESVLEFLDVFSLYPGQVPSFSAVWDVHGQVSAIPGQGGARAFGQLWMFPFGPLPQPFAMFQAQYYSSSYFEPGKTRLVEVLGSTKNLPPGSSYWVYGRLSVEASRVNDQIVEWGNAGTSFAEFRDTAEFFFTPDPGTPADSYTTASGFIYPTIPEPASAGMLAIGLLCIAMYRVAGRAKV